MLYTFDVTTLIPWARRLAGDVVTLKTESFVGDGVTQRFTIQDSGWVTVTQIQLDYQTADPSTYTASGVNITFPSAAPAVGEEIDVTYNQATNSDTAMDGFLTDAVISVTADCRGEWKFDPDTLTIYDDGRRRFFIPQMNDAGQTHDPTTGLLCMDTDTRLRNLIAIRTAVNCYENTANIAAGQAISIKDGDTVINTSLTSKSVEAAVTRMNAQYDKALKVYRTEAFYGRAVASGNYGFDIFVRVRDDGSPVW